MGNRSTILYHRAVVTSEGGTQEDRRSGCWTSRSKRVGRGDRQIRYPALPRRDGELRKGRKPADSKLPRKASSENAR
jgi:hypothetical protein